MDYINRTARLLDGTEKVTPGAVFYFAENDWMSGNEFMFGDVPAKLLYDEHTDYDIIPLDYLKKGEIKDGKLVINGHKHSFLVIPEAKHYPPELFEEAERFAAAGFPVYTLEAFPGHYGKCPGKPVCADELKKEIREKSLAFDYGIPASKVRIAEYDGENEKIFFIFNEEPCGKASLELTLPVNGCYSELRFFSDEKAGGRTENGRVGITLEAGESAILIFDGKESPFPAKQKLAKVSAPEISWDIFIKEKRMPKMPSKKA